MRISKIWLIALLLAVFMAGCGGKSVEGGGTPAPALDTTPPTVSFTNPLDGTAGVATNRKLTANFSEAMDPATCTGTTFTLTQAGTPVASSAVSCVGKIAIFTPQAPLTTGLPYTATVTTGFKDLAGNALAANANNTWNFTTGAADNIAPTAVLPTDPIDTSTGVPVNTNVSATFSEPIDPATVTAATFTLTSKGSGPGCPPFVFPDTDPCPVTPVDGTASPTGSGSVVTFVPTITLQRSTTGASGITQTYTATITTGVTDLAGNALASPLTWSFAAGAGASAGPYAGACPAPLALGTAAAFAVLAKTGVTNTGPSVITGNVGATTPHTSITGFSETLDPATGEFSTSAQLIGTSKIFATDYHAPTPDNLATDVSDMGLAYTDAAGRTVPAPTVDLVISAPLTPGLYKWTTGLNIGSITLSATSAPPNDAKDAWIFQIAGDLNVANNAVVTLSNGALAKNVFWQVGGQATLGTSADFKGTILSKTLISLDTGAVLTGRALAQTAVTLNQNTVTKP